ncbi:MAG TPA: hypothetical protein VMW42_02120 [Desulfatiglandales bacterium]|nr:hypothetical protein [Desulfatiglandales bacterium]
MKEPDKVGDKRLSLKFAWLPVVVEKKKIWLESYWFAEEFCVIGSLRRYEAWRHRASYLKENKPKPKGRTSAGNWMDEV